METMNMPHGLPNIADLTDLMDDALRNVLQKPGLSVRTPNEFFGYLDRRISVKKMKWDASVILEHWCWLQRTGAIALTGVDKYHKDPSPFGTEPLPGLHITARGRKWLESGEVSPHNPTRFYERIRADVASLDEVVMAYLDEAVGAWAAGLNRAAAVMIGCACEQLILLLAESLSKASVPPYSERLKKHVEKTAKPPASISTIFKDVRDALLALAGEKKLPHDIADALDRKLTPIFEYSRALRNASGHPTAGSITDDDAEGALILFPGFYLLVNDVIRTLDEMNAPDTEAPTA
jgi:hypothetical protein